MDAARWITAREGRRNWWSALTTWRTAKRVQTEPAMPVPSPLVLIGTFHAQAQFDEAARAFEANAFGAEDVEFITFEPAAPVRWRDRFLAVLNAVVNRTREKDAHGAGMFRSCAGIVIVRSAACFGRACQIIERCGGTIGLPAANLS